MELGVLRRKNNMHIYDSDTLFIAIVLFLLHFLAHYIVVRNQYTIYQYLQELGYQEVLNRYIQTVGKFLFEIYPSYPALHIYLIIALVACGALMGLAPIIHKLIKFMYRVFRKSGQRIKDDNIWLLALILSYLIIYFTYYIYDYKIDVVTLG